MILEIAGNDYFAPEFTESISHYNLTLQPEPTQEIVILDPYPWPDKVEHDNNANWTAALTSPDMTQIIGDVEIWNFGWDAAKLFQNEETAFRGG